MGYREILDRELEAAGILLPPDTVALLTLYCNELIRWNLRVNLTALEGEALVRRLVIEPIWIARELGISDSVADIGSGNGSPGFPMHIARGLERIHLVEARTKRAAFLRHAAATLKLEGVHVHGARLDAVVSEIPPVQWVTMQAVALTEDLVKSIRRISTATTTIVWITSSATAPGPLEPSHRLSIPFSTSEARIYRVLAG